MQEGGAALRGPGGDRHPRPERRALILRTVARAAGSPRLQRILRGVPDCVADAFQFRVLGTEHHIIPDVVLFLNGLPAVVIECKSPNIKDAIREAINQRPLAPPR